VEDVLQNQVPIIFTNEEWLEWEQMRIVEGTIPLEGRFDLYVEAHLNREQAQGSP
jgi:hypothetical protein